MYQPAAGRPAHEERSQARDAVLAAARQCYLRNGVRKTTMDQVATAAGTTRQAVYKLFLGRQELVEAAACARFAEIAADVTHRLAAAQSTGTVESFVDTSLAVIEAIRDDGELKVLLAEDSPVSLHDAVWLEPVARGALVFWAPWLAQARSRGLLRDDLSDADLADWLQTIYPSIILRRGLNREDERAMIDRFVLTSLAMVTRPII